MLRPVQQVACPELTCRVFENRSCVASDGVLGLAIPSLHLLPVLSANSCNSFFCLLRGSSCDCDITRVLPLVCDCPASPCCFVQTSVVLLAVVCAPGRLWPLDHIHHRPSLCPQQSDLVVAELG
jgi:hypothetical protein